MLKKIWIKALVIVLSVVCFGVNISITEAKSLKSSDLVKKYTAIIVAEDFSQKNYKPVTNLTHIEKMSEATEWIENNAYGKNIRFVSVDAELIEAWKKAATRAHFKFEKTKIDDNKISEDVKEMLKKGTKYSFEIKNKKSSKWNLDNVDRTVNDAQAWKKTINRIVN